MTDLTQAEEAARKDRKRCTYDPKMAALSSPAMRKRLDSHALAYLDAYVAAWWATDEELLQTRGFKCIA